MSVNSGLSHCGALWRFKSWEVHPCQLIWVKIWVSKSPPKKKHRDLLTWSTHFRMDALTSKRSFQSGLPVARASWNYLSWSWSILDHHITGHFFLDPRKMLQRLNIFGGDIQNIHQIFFEFSLMQCPKSKVGLRASARAIHLGFLGASNLPVSVVHLCAVYPTAPLKVVNIFSWKNFKTGSKMDSNRRSSDLFPRKSCSSVQVKDVLCNTLVGTMLRFDFDMQTPIFTLRGWREHPKG